MKTLKSYQIFSENGLFVIKYTNNLSVDTTVQTEVQNIFNGTSVTTKNDLDSLVNSYVQSLPNTNDRVRFIEFKQSYFTIIGEKLPPKLQGLSELIPSDLAIYDAFNTFVLSYTGVAIVTISSELNTGRVTLNGIVYSGQDYTNLVQASNGTLYNATMMAIRLFNS